jgi:tetratricopeptide (TPR) repeat protein
MDAKAVIDAIEADPSVARRLLRQHREVTGVGREYFSRIMSHYGSDMRRVAVLAAQWRAVLNYTDEPAFAYRAKGISDMHRCDWLASARSFIRAGDEAADPVDRLSFKAGAIESLVEHGRLRQASTLASQLVKGLRELGQAGQAARIQLGLANALIRQDRMKAARELLEQAVPALAASGLAIEHASALMSLSTTHLYAGNPQRAHALALDADNAATELNASFLSSLCKLNIGHALLLMGRSDEALDLLQEVRSLEEVSGEKARARELLADSYFRLNLWPEAADAYAEVLSTPGLFPNQAANARLGQGLCLIAREQYADALPLLKGAQRRYEKLGNRAWAASAMTAQARALASLGRKREALAKAKKALDWAKAAGSSFHYCEALLFAAELESDVSSLATLSRRVRRDGFVGLNSSVLRLQARSVSGARRLSFYRRMFEEIAAGRLLVRSSTSRAGYMRDKSDAIREYLSELLERPTQGRVREALSVIERSRSVTLLDEISSAYRSQFDSSALESLEELRKELRELSTEESGGGARRLSAGGASMASLQRRWVDATRASTVLLETVVSGQKADTAVFVETGEALYALNSTSVSRLPIAPLALEQELRWAEFELLAPMTERDCDAAPALDALASLRQSVLVGFESGAVCPDGLLWRFPWSACAALETGGEELEVSLHPSLGGSSQRKLPKHPRAALWISGASDLKFAEEEAARFCGFFPGARVCRTARDAKESLLQEIEVLHVISHAHHRRDNPMFSSLEFGDDAIYATDIALSGAKVGLVTLSACDTGMMSLVTREEPDGLARAFLARGAYHVVASAWPLDDEAAALAYSLFYEGLTDGLSVKQALKVARAKVRAWRPHPYFWGALTLYRGYSNDD